MPGAWPAAPSETPTCSVPAAAEPVTAGGAAAAGGLWGDAAEFGEGCLAVQAVGVVAGGDEELAGDVCADTAQADQGGGGGRDQGGEVCVELGDLLVAVPALSSSQRSPSTTRHLG